MLKLSLKDEEYPFDGFDHERKIARAFVLREGKIALHHIHRDDMFGNENYLETPGGGVDEGETFAEAVKRECLEETGYDIELLAEIGEVKDAYNLIRRANINRFFLAVATEQHPKHFVSSGDLYIIDTRFYTFDEAIALYEKQSDRGVSGLVKRRELPMLLEAKRIAIELGLENVK